MKRSRAERRLLLSRRLEQARAQSQELSEAVEFYGALIGALIDEEPAIELPELAADARQAKLQSGQPILRGEALGFDTEAIRALLVKLCTVTEAAGQLSADVNPKRLSWLQSYKAERNPAYARAIAAAQIRRALGDGALDFERVLAQLVRGEDDELASLAMSAKLDSNLLIALAHFAMRPTMLAYAEAYAETVSRSEQQWMRGTCPVCGGPPLLGEYRDQDQSRHLRCATCASAWLFPRLACPYCGTDQFRLLSFIRLEDQAQLQADTCANCRHYIKAVFTSEPILSDLLPLEDLLTLPLDAAAQQQGFQRA